MVNIFHRLSNAISQGPDVYRLQYMKHVSDVIATISNPSLLTSHILAHSPDEAEQLLRCSLVFNDLTLYTLLTAPQEYVSLRPEWFSEQIGHAQIRYTVPSEETAKYGVPSGELKGNLAFLFPTGSTLNSYLAELEPVIRRKRLLLQPYRTIAVPREHLANPEQWTTDWVTIEVTPECPLDHWEAKSETPKQAIPIRYESSDHLDHTLLFKISVPYLVGLPLNRLSSLIQEESDLIPGVRRALREAISSLKASDLQRPGLAQELIRDEVEPKIRELERRLRDEERRFRKQISAAGVMTMSMALMAAFPDGFPGALLGTIGALGIGNMIKSINEISDAKTTLRDNPYYFYWKCRMHQTG